MTFKSQIDKDMKEQLKKDLSKITKQQELPKEFEDMVDTLLFPDKFWNIFEKLQKEEYNKGIAFAKEEMLKDEIEWLKSLNQNDIREITKDIRISQLQLKVRRR